MKLLYQTFLVLIILVSVQSSTILDKSVKENETCTNESQKVKDPPTKLDGLVKSSPQADDDLSFEVDIPPGPDNKSVLGCSAEICFGVCLLQGRYGGCRRDKCKCKGKFP